MNAGDLSGKQAPEGVPAEVRAAVVAKKPGNSGGAKGGRKADASSERSREEKPPSVPAADKQGGEDLWEIHRAQRGVWSEKMLAALQKGVKGSKWFSLADKVYAMRTLELAWEKVADNAGACGVDGITVERFKKDSQTRLLVVNEHLRKGSYQPKPVKRVWIPKPGSAEKRPLGIPTVTDRVVQTAVKMVIEPIFERTFAEHSYGFRPGRSCKDALRRVTALLEQGHVHVVDVDIKSYFDTILHDRLMERVKEHIADGRVLGLIESFLKQGIMEEMEYWEAEGGTPQGGIISPLLANIYLNEQDRLLAEHGFEVVRYADDEVVLCRDPEKAHQALELIGQWMQENGLTLHPEKTKVVNMAQTGSHFDFLGYRFWRSRRGHVRRFVRPKSEKKLKTTIKPLTKRANGHSLDAIIQKINPILRGWGNYFKHADKESLIDVDGWVRGRLRSILRKRKKLKGRARGRDHQLWPNCYFANLGLFCLEQLREEALASLRKGANC